MSPRTWVPAGVNSAGDQITTRAYTDDTLNLDYEEDVKATKAAEDKAAELGVDLSSVQGTGKGGKITVGDVEDAAG